MGWDKRRIKAWADERREDWVEGNDSGGLKGGKYLVYAVFC